MQKFWYVYGLRRQFEDEYRYVGLTTGTIQGRLSSHLRRAKDQSRTEALYSWARKYTDIVADELSRVPQGDYDVLAFEEQKWIATFREQPDRVKPLLNLADGGLVVRGWKHSEEWKQAARERFSGEGNPMYGVRGENAPCYGRTGEAHPMYGTHHSDEAKAKISASSLGKKHSEATRQRMSESQQLLKRTDESRDQSRMNMHVRWHIKRNMTNPSCKFCVN